MSPDDPRHGSYAGYVAGCRCDACAVARRRAVKEQRSFAARYGSCMFDHSVVDRVIGKWLAMGLTHHAILEAAGLSRASGSWSLSFTERRPVNRRTLEALMSITEDKLPSGAKINADLTRVRIYSLMAAGHSLKDMPLNATGFWRTREHITVGFARTIRAYFQEHEMLVGANHTTMTRARNAGHLPPAAWDDPGTLAWIGEAPDLRAESAEDRDIDLVAIRRACEGDRTVRLTRDEKVEAVRIWRESGRSLKMLEQITGWRAHRYIREAA